MIPQQMQGAWVRAGIGIGGAEPAEDTRVWWLQTATRHCDLRVPYTGGEGVMSFAGTTTWAEPSLTWHPEVELDPSVFTDTGVISWDGPDLIETGVFHDDGREVGYVERWQRLPGTTTGHLALSREFGRLVRTGSAALTIVDDRPRGGAFAAVAWTLTEGAWEAEFCWPPAAAAPAPPLDIPTEGDSVVLGDGTTWSIDER